MNTYDDGFSATVRLVWSDFVLTARTDTIVVHALEIYQG